MGQAARALLVNEESVDPEVEQLAIANIARPENRIRMSENYSKELLFRYS